MAFLHCHNCDFSQDDFWSPEGWNPFKSLETWRDDLFRKDIDEPFTTDSGFIRENGNISRREVVAREFERAARKIRGMAYRTYEEFKEKNPDRACPVCGKRSLDID